MFRNITEIPELSNLSKETLNEKLKLKELLGHVVRKQGFTYIDEEGLNLIKASFKDATKKQPQEATKGKEDSQDISAKEDILNLNKDLFDALTEQLKEKDLQLKEKDLQLKEKDLQFYELNERLKQEQELNRNNQVLLKVKPEDIKLLEELDMKLIDIKDKIVVKESKEAIESLDTNYGQHRSKKYYEKFKKKKENKN